jgi:hypothetical protein
MMRLPTRSVEPGFAQPGRRDLLRSDVHAGWRAVRGRML